MKKLLTILGVVFAVIIVIVVIAAVIFIPGAIKRDHEAMAYIKEAIPKIVTGWKSQELVDRATPELLDAAGSRDKVDRMFDWFRQLGSFKYLDEPEGMVTTSSFTGSGTVTLGNYKTRAEFEKGPARIEIQLLRVGNTWKINSFKVFSDALFPPKA
jgi:hypothetical protein